MHTSRADKDPVLSHIRAMPKAELHIHLEGSIQPATLLDLARRHARLHDLPATDVAGLRRWFRFVDFPHFVEIYLTVSSLLRSAEDFALITYACGRDMAAQNIRYREVTFTPYTHTHVQDKNLTIVDLLQGLDQGRARAKADFGVEIRWVFDIPRHSAFRNGAYDPTPAEITLDYATQGIAHGVIGLGLGGIEQGAPPAPFAHAFTAAKARGLLSLPHAGETVGAASVREAVDFLVADRIGHGVRAIEDPALLVLLRDRQIPLELNPTSNVCLHVYRRLAEHPLPHLDRMGIVVTVNSDDPPLFNTSLTQEFTVLVREFGYGIRDLVRIARNAFLVAGVSPEVRGRLLAEFDDWAASSTGITFPAPAAGLPTP